ncbi:MAG: hypothetical protein K8U03_27065 [Planctomycetia bacterium]|nr:hypothetical protein [Planctomycetia bacterium]
MLLLTAIGRRFFTSSLSVLLLSTCAGAAAAATRIELVVDEATHARTVAWPVTTGVPFPLRALTDERRCRLVDDTGAEQPLQAKAAATWDAARSSIRWLTIDFIARPGRKYALEFGPDVRRKEFPPVIGIVDRDDVVVATGALEVEFSRQGPAVLGSVRFDLDGDGKIGPSERIASGPTAGDHKFVDQNNHASTGTRDGADRQVVVEATGPVRACVRVDGWYTGSGGRRIVAYRTRYHLFAGLSLMKAIDEFRIVGSTRDVQFHEIALPLALDLAGDKRTVATAEGVFGKPPTYEVSAVQETYRHYGNPLCKASVVESSEKGERTTHDSQRVGPWMQVVDGRAAITGSLRNLSQQFPKEWQYEKNQLTLHLQSPRAEPLDFGETGLKKFFGPAGAKYLLDWKANGGSSPISDFFYYAGRHALKRDGADGLGINKHHEIWYHFGLAADQAAGREYGALADQQPLCLATGKWNVDTGVFGPLAARPSKPLSDNRYEAIVDRIFDLERTAQDDFGDYGWFLFGAGPHYSYQWDPETKKHYADPRRFEYHTYQRETQLWWTYFRSGERKFYDWCLPSENHWVDIAVAHTPTMYSTEWRGGKAGEAQLHYPAGDWSIDSPLHYVRHHDTGEAWLRSASQYWATYHRTLETTTLAYYLTGDERYNDVVDFWKAYWGALAGIRSDSAAAKPWHKDQMWWVPTAAGAPTKSWAEMLRDYAPFQSGSRHQQTLFFNLSTMYEHTWDPTIRQVLDEYAAAFIQPENPNGVWQCQDHRLPANADSPLLAHFWAPALWKYARASGDPRMPDVLKKYFTACLDADPYGGDVGIYSNNQIAWAWHFTRDPRAIIAAKHELDKLLPNAEPLAKPEDLGQRIYNPYAPIAALAAVPRLIGIIEEAQPYGSSSPPTSALEPQRTLIAARVNSTFRGTLWGWDPAVEVYDVHGIARAKTSVGILRSHRQPFDRSLAGFQVFRTEFTSEESMNERWLYLSPKLETGILELADGLNKVWCWAGEPVEIAPRERWYWQRTSNVEELTIETARPGLLRVSREGPPLLTRIEKNRLIVSFGQLPKADLITIEATDGQAHWFRIADLPDAECWVTPQRPTDRKIELPPMPAKLLEARRKPALEVDEAFTTGRFGKGLYVAGKNEFEIPDEITTADGSQRRLSDQRQGSIDFWVRRLVDERLQQVPVTTILYAGSIYVTMPKHVPLDEWAHVAIDWFPLADDPEQVIVAVYVNGVDHGNYRSIYWAGYGDRPQSFTTKQPWLKKFVIKAPPGAAFAIDDLRISSQPRYIDVKVPFGRTQTFNPNRFMVPTSPAEFDATTVLLAPFDGKLECRTKEGALPIATIRIEAPAAKGK